MAAIEIQALSKRFGGITAVDDLSFSTREGAVTGFLGPNGAGKTTTLRMLLGLVSPTEGTATVDGRPYAKLAEPTRHVGAVLESTGFHPGRRARQHLRVLATAAGLPLERVDEVVIIANGRLVTQSSLADLAQPSRSGVRVRTPHAETLRAALTDEGIAAELVAADVVMAFETTTEAVGLAAAGAAAVIYEMTAERFDLEELFLELTTSEGALQ